MIIESVSYFFYRKIFDTITGYSEKPIPVNSTMSVEELRKKGYLLTEAQWLYRILFLETIAAVPGMVAATIRHLQSLRLMRRDSGWIHTLLVRCWLTGLLIAPSD
jgi:ubiquinol oxidase